MNRVEIRYKIDQAYSSMNKYKTKVTIYNLTA